MTPARPARPSAFSRISGAPPARAAHVDTAPEEVTEEPAQRPAVVPAADVPQAAVKTAEKPAEAPEQPSPAADEVAAAAPAPRRAPVKALRSRKATRRTTPRKAVDPESLAVGEYRALRAETDLYCFLHRSAAAGRVTLSTRIGPDERKALKEWAADRGVSVDSLMHALVHATLVDEGYLDA